jgi:hypothetical protein
MSVLGCTVRSIMCSNFRNAQLAAGLHHACWADKPSPDLSRSHVTAVQFAYALRALVINEFRSPQWQQRVLGVPGASTMGQAALISFDFYTDEIWIAIGIGFL